jgi:hypothetical protein
MAKMPPISQKAQAMIDKLTADRDALIIQNGMMLAEQSVLNERISELQVSLHEARLKLNERTQELTTATKVTCDCGVVLARSSMRKHLQSPTHLLKIKCMLPDRDVFTKPDFSRPTVCGNCDGEGYEYYGDDTYGPCLKCSHK